MKWELNLDVCALLILLVLTFYTVRRRDLPLRRTRIFHALEACCWLVALTDILASVMCSFPHFFPVWSLYGINILYYLLKVSSPVLLFYYCLLLRSRYSFLRRFEKAAIAIPAGFMWILIALSPVFKFVFFIGPDGSFHYGYGRHLIFVVILYYLLASTVCVFRRWNELGSEVRFVILFNTSVVIIGNVLQTFFMPHTQTVSLCSTLGILALFLVYQNPDYYRDHATGLFDVDGLFALKREDLRYKRYRLMQVMIIDNYQDLRPIYGDAHMDELLHQVGRVIRQYDTEGFCFYLKSGRFLTLHSTEEQRTAIREHLLDRFSRPFFIGQEEFYLSPGFFYGGGERSHTSGEEELEILLELATEELRQMGPWKILPISEELMKRTHFQSRVGVALERALQDDNLLVFYQPIYATKKGRAVSAEALVRIMDPELGMIYPGDFIEISEKNGSIIRLGQIVFEKTCEFIERIDMDALGLEYIEINLSPVQCMRDQLAEELQQVMYRHHIDAKRINLEITESSHSNNLVIKKNIMELSNYGLEFSLDDYGTGYSNLINVLSLPLKIVKVDKSIVWAYFKDNNPTLLHVLELFKDSNLEIVCEGVEDLEMARILKNLGVDYEQGYYFSKPVPEDEFLAYLGNQRTIET
jgi:EAL domain-containing protein (putative c-di-GMP-specific phosphodiesterase class I)